MTAVLDFDSRAAACRETSGQSRPNQAESIMAVFNPQTVFTRRVPESRIWLAYDDRCSEWVAEVILRKPAAMTYFVHRYSGTRPAWRTLRSDARRYGHLSPRPYQLGQACDGSITTCVLALYEDFCRSRKLDPIALVHRAYDDVVYTKQDFDAIRRDAYWERTAYPAEWNHASIKGLLESLHEVNYHSLATVVEEITDVTSL
jgi:hypothetical protein